MRGYGATPSEEGAAVKSLGEKLGGASSEEEATRWASRWGARVVEAPRGLCRAGAPVTAPVPAPGWSPGEAPKSRAVEGLPMASAVGAPPRRGCGGGRRVGLPVVPPRRSVGDDPVRGYGAASSEEGAAVKPLGEGLLAAPSEEGAAGWPLWGATVVEGPRVLCRGGAPVSGLGEGVAREPFPWGLRGALGEGARGGQCGGGAPRSSPTHGPRVRPLSLRGGGGGVLQPWLSGGKSAPSGD